MSPRIPDGHRVEQLAKDHPRQGFRCGRAVVDDWLRTKALQHQSKRLSNTKVLLDAAGEIVGFYTLAMEVVDFDSFPADEIKRLPKRPLPTVLIAWLGVSVDRHGEGLGRRLLALALHDCAVAGRTLPFIAVVLDCIDDDAKAFYRRFDFQELPGRPNRMFLPASKLELMLGDS